MRTQYNIPYIDSGTLIYYIQGGRNTLIKCSVYWSNQILQKIAKSALKYDLHFPKVWRLSGPHVQISSLGESGVSSMGHQHLHFVLHTFIPLIPLGPVNLVEVCLRYIIHVYCLWSFYILQSYVNNGHAWLITFSSYDSSERMYRLCWLSSSSDRWSKIQIAREQSPKQISPLPTYASV